jgi:ceramide glucosyltransferase
MRILSSVPYLVLGMSFLVLGLSTLLTILNRKPGTIPARPIRDLPPVSLLIPIRGLDDGLEENLTSFYESDYPDLEVLFGVDDEDDEVVPLLKGLAVRYPGRPTRVIAAGGVQRDNPKVHKLARLERYSRGKLFWVCDSNIRVERDTLRHLVEGHLERGARIVFSPIRGTSSRSFASLIENGYLNSFLSGSVITAWKVFGQQVVCGKSILIDREALRRFGGFRFYRDYLAEDYLLGESFVRGGFPIAMNGTWVTNINQRTTLAGFWGRMSRWAKLRWHLRPGLYLLEVLLNPIALALPLIVFRGLSGLALVAGVALAKVILEAHVFALINTQDRTRVWNIVRFPAAVVVKDILLLGVYFTPFLSRTVNWRGGKIGIGRRTLITTPLTPEGLNYDGA